MSYIEALIEKEKTATNEEWQNQLVKAAKELKMSVEDVLGCIEKFESENDPEYIAYLEKMADEYHEMIEGAEDSKYGCDPYSEY